MLSDLLGKGNNAKEETIASVEDCRREEKQIQCRLRRNWYVDRGLIFDLRMPDDRGEKLDYTRRADRRYAWKELAKEEPLLTILGEPVSARGMGEHRRFCGRICRE